MGHNIIHCFIAENNYNPSWENYGQFEVQNVDWMSAESSACAGKDLVFTPQQWQSAKDQNAVKKPPEGVFGQKYPQNITTKAGYASIDKLGVMPEGDYKDANKVGLDGLPHVGAVIWPEESYYNTYDIYKGKTSEPQYLLSC